jgi:hypothetical protein
MFYGACRQIKCDPSAEMPIAMAGGSGRDGSCRALMPERTAVRAAKERAWLF